MRWLSLIHLSMKMTGWLSDAARANLFDNLRSRTCLILRVVALMAGFRHRRCVWASLSSAEALRKHFLLLPYSLSSASNIQPTVM